MRSRALLFIFFLVQTIGFSQTDSTVYTGKPMEDGVYLSYEDFRKNKRIKKEQIVSKLDKQQLEFLGKTLFEETFSYEENGAVITAESKKSWGYFQNNTLYVNYKSDFYRVPVFGSISYLVANVTVMNSGFYDPTFGYGMGSSTTKEIREFIMNFYDGYVDEFTMERAEELLSRDAVLFEEYKKQGRRKQKEQVYRYIRKYNELHPVYFLNY